MLSSVRRSISAENNFSGYDKELLVVINVLGILPIWPRVHGSSISPGTLMGYSPFLVLIGVIMSLVGHNTRSNFVAS